MEDVLYKIKSAIFGHAVGDALGVPVEFTSREERKASPVTKMIGYGTFPYPAGTWSDDTSMTLACLDSLAEGINYEDMMVKFCQWFEHAKYTPSDEVFDIGNATRKSLLLYLLNGVPALECGQKSEWDNGNGSLMRTIPIILYLTYSTESKKTVSEKIEYIENASMLTHGHKRSLIGCGIYAFVLFELLKKQDKTSLFKGIKNAKDFYKNQPEFEQYCRIFNKDFKTLPEEKIYGDGYVVSCLEAALWCLITTDSYKECVLKAVNLGDDTDTTAAVVGGLAGVLYGYDSIPKTWINTLKRKTYINELCENATRSWVTR